MSLRDHFIEKPWRWILLIFLPLVVIAAFAVYYSTIVPGVFPTHEESVNLLRAANLTTPESLDYPIFQVLSRWAASIPWSTLPYRSHLFSAISTALAAGLFFIWMIQLITYLSFEDPGGDQRLFFSPDKEDMESDDPSFAFVANFPERIQKHNRSMLYISIVGGFIAVFFFIFSPPIWISATRLLPYGFESLLLFLVLVLFFAYVQGGNRFPLYLCLFLSALLWIESPLFLLLLPFFFFFLLRTLFLEEGRTFSSPIFFALLFTLLGVALGYAVLLGITVLMGASVGYFSLFLVYFNLMAHNSLEMFTEFSALPSLIFFTLPILLLFVLYPRSFRKRSIPYLFLQLIWVGLLTPVILNLPMVKVTSPTHISALNVFNFTMLAIGSGFLVSAWFSARDNQSIRGDKEDEEEIALVYGIRNNPFVMRAAPFLAIAFLLFILVMPFRMDWTLFRDSGRIYMNVVHEISQQIEHNNWLIDSGDFQNLLLLNGHLEGKQIHLLSLDEEAETFCNHDLPESVKTDPLIPETVQCRLQNAADISPVLFVRQWMEADPAAPKRGCFFSRAPLDPKRFNLLPCAFFLKCQPMEKQVDWHAVIKEFDAFLYRMESYLLNPPESEKRAFKDLHDQFSKQIAFVGNEFGCCLANRGLRKEAVKIFQNALRYDPQNYALLFNCYYLNAFDGLPLVDPCFVLRQIKAIPEKSDFSLITKEFVLENYGDLIAPEVLANIRKNIWLKNLSYQSLQKVAIQQSGHSGMIFKTKGDELKPLVQKYLDENKFEKAEELLDILMDIDEKDPFVLINQCKIALRKNDLLNAGVWMDLAQEVKIPEKDLLWQKAAMLLMEGKDKEAKAYLNHWIPDYPTNIYLWGLLTVILQKEKNYVELENRVYPAMRHATFQNDHYMFYRLKGYLAEFNKRDTAARAAYLQTLQLNPSLPETWNQLLLVDKRMDISSFSTEDAKNALKYDPFNPLACYLFGLGRFRNNQYDLAMDLFERCYGLNRDPFALAGMGACFLGKGDLDKAARLLDKAVQAEPKNPFAWNQIARIHLHKGQIDQAAQAVDRALKLKNDFADARITQTAIWFKKGEIRKAVEQLANLLSGISRFPLSLRLEIEKMEQEHQKALPWE